MPRNSPTSPPAVANYGGIFDYDEKASKLEEVNRALEDPAVWNNAERAQELGKEKRQLEDVVLTLQKIDAQSRDLKDLFDLAEAELNRKNAGSSALCHPERSEGSGLRSMMTSCGPGMLS